MERHEALITEPEHDEEYHRQRWLRFAENPKQSQWVWRHFVERAGDSIKTTDQDYVEEMLENVTTNKRRKNSGGHTESNV